MAITELQKAKRAEGIGSSDAPAILGLSPWKGPYDIWAEKVGLVEPSELDPIKAKIGGLLEPVARQLLEDEIGQRVVASTGTLTRGILRANIDAFIGKSQRGNPIAEIKSTGYVEEFGDPELGDEAIPLRHLVQINFQLLVAESSLAYLPLITGDRGFGFRLYKTSRDPAMCHFIEDTLGAWWEKHVVGGVEPDRNVPPQFETLNRMKRIEGKSVTIDPSLIQEYADAAAACKLAEETKDVVRRKIATFLEDADTGECSLGKATYKSQVRESFDAAAFKAAHPDLHAEFTKPKPTARILMVYPKKAAKEAAVKAA